MQERPASAAWAGGTPPPPPPPGDAAAQPEIEPLPAAPAPDAAHVAAADGRHAPADAGRVAALAARVALLERELADSERTHALRCARAPRRQPDLRTPGVVRRRRACAWSGGARGRCASPCVGWRPGGAPAVTAAQGLAPLRTPRCWLPAAPAPLSVGGSRRDARRRLRALAGPALARHWLRPAAAGPPLRPPSPAPARPAGRAASGARARAGTARRRWPKRRSPSWSAAAAAAAWTASTSRPCCWAASRAASCPRARRCCPCSAACSRSARPSWRARPRAAGPRRPGRAGASAGGRTWHEVWTGRCSGLGGA